MQYKSLWAPKDFIISIPDIMKLKTKEEHKRMCVSYFKGALGYFFLSQVDMRTAEPCVAAFSPGARQTKLCAVMQDDTPAEMRGKTIARAFVTSLITGFVFVLFKWGAVGRGSSLSLICSSVCEINGQTSHLLGTYGPLTKHVVGEKVVYIRASTFCNSSASVHFACICQPSQEESVDVFEDEARTENPRGVKCTWEAGEERACNWVPCICSEFWDMPAGTGMGSWLLPPVRSKAVSKQMIRG